MKKYSEEEKILLNADIVNYIDKGWKDTGMPSREITEFSIDLCDGTTMLSATSNAGNRQHVYHSIVANDIKAGIYEAIEDYISNFSYTAASTNFTADALYSDKVKGDSELTRCVYQQNIFRYKNGARMQPGYIFTFVIFGTALLHTNALFDYSNVDGIFDEPNLDEFADRLLYEFDIPDYYKSKVISSDRMWAALLMGALLVANYNEKDEFLHQYTSLFLQQYIEKLHEENMREVFYKSKMLEERKRCIEEAKVKLNDLISHKKITAEEYAEITALRGQLERYEREMEISFANTYNNSWLNSDVNFSPDTGYYMKLFR